jgi:hypothetical protein
MSASSTSTSTAEVTNTAAVPSTTYTDAALQAALDGLLEGSEDPAHDARHIFGYNDPQHKLSMLQRITATRILDYQALARKENDTANSASEDKSKNYSERLATLEAQAAAFCRDNGSILPLHDVIGK